VSVTIRLTRLPEDEVDFVSRVGNDTAMVWPDWNRRVGSWVDEDCAVGDARARGWAWAEVGDLLGVTRAAVRNRHGPGRFCPPDRLACPAWRAWQPRPLALAGVLGRPAGAAAVVGGGEPAAAAGVSRAG
jgi:hypothetical protein